ncbi:MAG: AmmeMemoRadiSam system protein B, partial [Rhodospirillales bacterium]|nr:AmmeMemoRadiSam system protein B [Rhodospirillales bacterium]
MNQDQNWVRETAVAGQFYPGVAHHLISVVQDFLDGAAAPDAENVPKAIIAPHAGYDYSGAIAAHAYARLAPAAETITRVVLLGPCHKVAVRGLALSSAEAFRTPLGDIPLDRRAVDKILEFPQAQIIDVAHDMEHSLEVHLPFLQRVLGDFSLVPVAVGEATPDEVADVIEALWGGPETVFVISTDLSHFLDYDAARKIDARTCRAIETLDAAAITPDSACGRFPVAGMLAAAKRHDLTVTTLDLRNSGDTAGTKDRVVGYGAWMLQEARTGVARTGNNNNQAQTGVARTGNNNNQARTGVARTGNNNNQARTGVARTGNNNNQAQTGVARTGNNNNQAQTGDDFGAATKALLERHGDEILGLAVSSVRHGLKHGAPMPVNGADHAAELNDTGASFVTLKRDGKLRGCIGTAQAHRPLILDVAENAFRAAFKDPRFPALTFGEMDGIDLSVSVLSPQTPMTFSDEADFLDQLNPGNDGLIIEDKGHRALFLPSVWGQ